MKTLNVLQNGETKVTETKMNKSQKREYAQKVADALDKMLELWDWQSCNNHKHPTFEGLIKAAEHVENVMNTEDEIPMKFRFSKPEQCAIYFAFCFGAFDCLHLHELYEKISMQAVAMIKVLTSRTARAQVMAN